MHAWSPLRRRAGASLGAALVATLLAGAGLLPAVASPADDTSATGVPVITATAADTGGSGETGGIERGEQAEAREVAALLLRVLGITVAAVILLLVVGLPLRGWLRRRR